MREPAICFSHSALAAFRVTENKIITLKETIITLTKFIFCHLVERTKTNIMTENTDGIHCVISFLAFL